MLPALCVSVFLLSDGLFFRFDKSSLLFVPVLIIEAEYGIGRNKEPVQEIKPENEVESAGDFVQTSGDVADNDQEKENITFARRVFDLDGFHDGERPAESETDQHEGFENTGQRHKKTP